MHWRDSLAGARNLKRSISGDLFCQEIWNCRVLLICSTTAARATTTNTMIASGLNFGRWKGGNAQYEFPIFMLPGI